MTVQQNAQWMMILYKHSTCVICFSQVPTAVWSPFYLSLVENIVNRNGIINFFHDHLRQAVETKYLPTDADKKKGYLWLANYFDNKDIDDRVVSF